MDYYVPPRPWYRPRVRTLLVWVAAALVMSTVYSYLSDSLDAAAKRRRELLAPPVGALCLAELPRETSGTTSTSRSITGRFVTMNEQWVVLDGVDEDSPQTWIPRERIVVLNIISK